MDREGNGRPRNPLRCSDARDPQASARIRPGSNRSVLNLLRGSAKRSGVSARSALGRARIQHQETQRREKTLTEPKDYGVEHDERAGNLLLQVIKELSVGITDPKVLEKIAEA